MENHDKTPNTSPDTLDPKTTEGQASNPPKVNNEAPGNKITEEIESLRTKLAEQEKINSDLAGTIAEAKNRALFKSFGGKEDYFGDFKKIVGSDNVSEWNHEAWKTFATRWANIFGEKTSTDKKLGVDVSDVATTGVDSKKASESSSAKVHGELERIRYDSKKNN